MVALICTIGTDVPMGTVRLTTALWSYTHLTLDNFYADVMFGSLCLRMLQLHCCWLCIYYAYIMRSGVVQCSFVIAVAWRTCLNIHACGYVSAVSMHTFFWKPEWISTADM